MSDDDSNDVVMVENVEESTEKEDTETRPIMQLFHRLISNESKQNTVLTNAQIISILHKEFDVEVTALHELEVDIYLNIVKRFLKEWPKWDEFDQGINVLRKRNAYKSLKKALEEKYITLKNYLQIQLDATIPLAQEAVKKMVEENTKKMEEVDTSEITLEVYCTRKQLNQLVLNQPIIVDNENTVFNVVESQPTSITVNKLPIQSILNWCSVKITIDTKCLYYTRTSSHRLKHVLVNTKNNIKTKKHILDTKLKIKDGKKKYDDSNKDSMLKVLNNMCKSGMLNVNNATVFQAVVEIIKSDMHSMNVFKVPATYHQFTNQYPYCRKLKQDVSDVTANVKYDMYVEETLAPMHVFQIGKIGKPSLNFDSSTWFAIECLECNLKFSGDELYVKLREHFDMYHSEEPDWSCTNCAEIFTMTELSKNKWVHKCKK